MKLNNLTINSFPDQNIIQIYFSYSIRNTNIQDEIIINFNNYMDKVYYNILIYRSQIFN